MVLLNILSLFSHAEVIPVIAKIFLHSKAINGIKKKDL